MTYRDVVVLIPSHSLEDFPTDLGDRPAASLLNSFAVAWHPALLAMTGTLPAWHRADDPPSDVTGRLIFVPMASDTQIPHGWVERVRGEGAVVVSGLDDREQMVRAALVPILRDGDDGPALADDADLCAEMELDPELVADFHALGLCWLMLELLTRHMHHFSSFDEIFLEKTVVAAAQAALDGDVERARDRLQACFDLLAEARERFYPVDCYLMDLCLLSPDVPGPGLDVVLDGGAPVNFLLKASDAVRLAEKSPEDMERLKAAWAAGTADVSGGDFRELPSPLVPLASTLWDLDEGRRVYRRLLDREPTTWGRRRFGLSAMAPQVLQKSGFHAALHFLLDDGIYPDREQSRMRWEGCDNSTVDAYSRIPLAAEAANTWLRFPQRLAETMESDQVAALILARWPEIRSPFFRDLQRMQRFAPVLGRFVTFHEFFLHTSHDAGSWSHEPREYLSPFLVQAVARRESRPLSRFREHSARMARWSRAAWMHGIAAGLMGRPVDGSAAYGVQAELEAAGPDAYSEPDEKRKSLTDAAESALTEFERTGGAALSRIVLHGAGNQSGWLVANPLSFARRAVVELPGAQHTPATDSMVRFVQPADAARNIGPRAVVDLPPAGYAWIPDSAGAAGAPSTWTALAEANLLRNELFEVSISDVTGGIQRLKKPGRSPNRISQQLAFRFPREVVVRRHNEDGSEAEEERTWYSEMRCRSLEVTSTGPALGEITTTGEVVDPSSGTVLAEFRQTFRMWRGLPYLEMEIELDVKRKPEGDPWSNFYASRFAWNDSTAALSQSVQGAAQPVRMERIESPDFFEIATTEEERTTILPVGLPFHRRTGPRMLDSLLVVDGDGERRFRFVIGVDQLFPMQAALDQTDPVCAVRTGTGPPRTGRTGWFYHLDSRCVQVLAVLPLLAEPVRPVTGTDLEPAPEPLIPAPTGPGFALRLQETEGRYQSVYLELFRTPVSARVRDFRGQTIGDLVPVAEGVRVELGPFAIAEVEVRFE